MHTARLAFFVLSMFAVVVVGCPNTEMGPSIGGSAASSTSDGTGGDATASSSSTTTGSGGVGGETSSSTAESSTSATSGAASASSSTSSTGSGGQPCASASNGTPCDDDDPCTQTDTCQSGSCVGANPVVCIADQCHTAGACDSATGQCVNPAKADNTACDDGNPCTQTDTCQSGSCTGADPVVCVADQCHSVGACDSATGMCLNPVKANNSACDDGDPCTLNDSCQNAVCLGSAPNTATDPHNCGTCGHDCFGDATSCVLGQCQIVDPGWSVTVPTVRTYGYLDTTPDGSSLYVSTLQGVARSPIGLTLPAPTLVVATPQVASVATNGTLITWGIGASGSHPNAATIGTWAPAPLATPATGGEIVGITMLGNYVWYVDFGGSGLPTLHRLSLTTQTDLVISLSPSPGYLGDVAVAQDGTIYLAGWSIYTQGEYHGGIYAVAPGASSGGLFWTSSRNNGASGLAVDDTYIYGAFADAVRTLRRDTMAQQVIPGTQGVGIVDVAVTNTSLFFVNTTGHLFRLAK